MSDFDSKVEELRERRSDALMGIVSSQQSYNEIVTDDNEADEYLFGSEQNTVGIFQLLDLYQQERKCEKEIGNYFIEDLSAGNIEDKVNIDINDAMNSSAEAPRFTSNYFYYIDGNYNILVNDGNKAIIAGEFDNAKTFIANEKPVGFSVGDLVLYNNQYDTIASINNKTITVTTGFTDWSGDNKTLQNLKTRNSIIFNNGEVYNASSLETRADTVKNDLGTTYTGNQIIYVDEEENAYEVLENSTERGNGFLKYWGSKNKVNGGFATTTIGGDNKIWIWHATNTSTYKTKEHISSLLADLNTLISKLGSLYNILSNIKSARTYISTSSYWSKMGIPADTITDEQITQIRTWKNNLTTYYNTLNGKKNNNYDWDGSSEPSSDTNWSAINGAISNIFTIYGNENSGLGKFLKNRFSTSLNVLGVDGSSGLRKWINFWLTEKISLDNGSYSSIVFLTQSIADEKAELDKAEARLVEVLGNDNTVIPTPNILAAYSEPRFDKATGKTLENRIGVVWDGQIHGKKYVVLRKSIKAFDYYSTSGNFAFKWDNSDWTVFEQKGDWSKEVYYPKNIDPENGLTKTEILEPIEDDEFYIFRVYEKDENPILLTNLTSHYSTALSKQSKMFDEDSERSFSSISNGVITCKNHGFKRGNVVLIESNVKDPEIYKKNPISGFYRVIDADENSFVLEGLPRTNFSGKFYKAFGVVSVKPLPYVSYDENGKPYIS